MCIVHTSITCPFSLTIRICILLIFQQHATLELIPAPFMRILNLHGIPLWMLCLPPSPASVLGSDHKNSDENDDHDRCDPDNDENRMTAEPGMTGFIRCFRRCAGS